VGDHVVLSFDSCGTCGPCSTGVRAVVVRQQHRLDLARELGATHAIAGGAGDVVEQVHLITGGGAAYSSTRPMCRP
jgi:Zn-dependent alcohol dehydrogenase